MCDFHRDFKVIYNIYYNTKLINRIEQEEQKWKLTDTN